MGGGVSAATTQNPRCMYITNIYRKHAEPWEYPLTALLTLCEDCHTEETQARPEEEQLLLRALREKGLLSADVNLLARAFAHANAP